MQWLSQMKRYKQLQSASVVSTEPYPPEARPSFMFLQRIWFEFVLLRCFCACLAVRSHGRRSQDGIQKQLDLLLLLLLLLCSYLCCNF